MPSILRISKDFDKKWREDKMLILFFVLWIIFNGKITTEIILFGVVISAAVFAFICKFMDYSLQKEKRVLQSSGFLLKYVAVLIVEIIKANLAVIHMILTDREVAEPVLIKFRTNLKSDSARVLLANAITLTPGTITVSLEEEEFVIHCLDKNMADGIEDSVFVRMLEEAEKRGGK